MLYFDSSIKPIMTLPVANSKFIHNQSSVIFEVYPLTSLELALAGSRLCAKNGQLENIQNYYHQKRNSEIPIQGNGSLNCILQPLQKNQRQDFHHILKVEHLWQDRFHTPPPHPLCNLIFPPECIRLID